MTGRREQGRREGASQSRTGLRDRSEGWLRHHRLSAADSLNRLLDGPLSTLLTLLVIGIALALPAGLSVALDNVGRLSANWDSPAQISLFLESGVPDGEARQLAATLAGRAEVAGTRFVSREEALSEFRKLSGFADVLDSLEENPLPNLVLVTPATAGSDAAGRLRETLAALPGVDRAVLDTAWLQRLNGLLQLARRLVLLVGGLLVLGVVLILGNTIRLAIENRREEIVIIKLVGGSDAFVRRPFLYTGLWYGAGGGAVAALLVAGSLWLLQAPVRSLAQLYGSEFRLQGLGLLGGLDLVVLGGILGLAGAWLAVARHLTGIRPH